MMKDQRTVAIASSGDETKDRESIERFCRSSDLIDAGLCPNGCGGMIEDDDWNAHCPGCNFAYFCGSGLNFKIEASA